MTALINIGKKLPHVPTKEKKSNELASVWIRIRHCRCLFSTKFNWRDETNEYEPTRSRMDSIL